MILNGNTALGHKNMQVISLKKKSA